jgi:hypothetical protein
MSRLSRIVRLYNEFRENAPNIAKYFGIHDYEYKLEFTAPDLFHFKIINETLPSYIFPTLPNELSMRICNFLYSKKVIEYRVEYPQDYPFNPPKWTLLTILTPLAYKNATRILNHQYDLSWSPAISVEIDILNMISTIQLCIEKDVS